MEIDIYIINKMERDYSESLEESGLFSTDQRKALTDAFRVGVSVLYYGIDDDY